VAFTVSSKKRYAKINVRFLFSEDCRASSFGFTGGFAIFSFAGSFQVQTFKKFQFQIISTQFQDSNNPHKPKSPEPEDQELLADDSAPLDTVKG